MDTTPGSEPPPPSHPCLYISGGLAVKSHQNGLQCKQLGHLHSMNFNPNILSSLPSGYYLPIFFAVSFYYSMNLNSSPRAGAQSNDLKRVEIKAEETTFPNLSHFWTLLQLNQINQRGRCKNAPHPLIFLFGSSVKG